jgi:uncharacterized membrane protein YbaN (DUF454 family)
MDRNRKSKGLRAIGLDRLPWKKPVPADQEFLESQTVVKRFWPRRRDEPSKVEFWVDEGVVEIRDARLFRVGQEPFCLALVKEMVRPGFAQRVEIRLASATCRIEFEPGEADRDKLATQVAAALKAATLGSIGRPSALPRDQDHLKWVTLTAVASIGGPSIWETLVNADGQVVSRPHLTIPASGISPHSQRPLRTLPRRIRSNPPKARAGNLSIPRRPVEPIALALSSESIFGKNSTTLAISSRANSKRMVNLALAGGSFGMAVAGVVLPGIPALPFVLLTGHYLVRSSPELCRCLANVPLIGSLLQKAEAVGGQGIDRRSLWKMLGLTVAAVTAFLILHPPLPVVILLETGILVYYGLREFRKPARTALPADLGSARVCLA